MIFDKDKLLVYAITDRILFSEEEKIFFNRVEEVLKSGIKCLQFRNKDTSREDFFKKAIVLRDLCKKYNALFIINDEVEIAIKIKADGVHVGQEDMEAQKARKMIGQDMILGVSCENLEQAILAEKNGADYLGVGAIFKTNSKDDAKTVSREMLKKICDEVKIPVVAIGGINEENMDLLSGLKLSGFAMIQAIFGASDVRRQCERLILTAKKIIGVYYEN